MGFLIGVAILAILIAIVVGIVKFLVRIKEETGRLPISGWGIFLNIIMFLALFWEYCAADEQYTGTVKILLYCFIASIVLAQILTLVKCQNLGLNGGETFFAMVLTLLGAALIIFLILYILSKLGASSKRK